MFRKLILKLLKLDNIESRIEATNISEKCIWIDVKKEMPPQTYGWDSEKLLVCTATSTEFGRTRKNEWVDMDSNPIDVYLWANIPEIPKDLQCVFYDDFKIEGQSLEDFIYNRMCGFIKRGYKSR